jgi:23S rRNA pseudouridine1911/1915/1917 synthase
MAESLPDRREITVTSDSALTTTPLEEGERLDHFLGRQFEDLSRSRVETLIREKAVTVDGEHQKASRPALPGQVIVLMVPPPEQPSLEPENIPLDIRFEDQHLVVVNKPAGMVVHPAPGHPDGTLVNALLYHCRDLAGIGGVKRPGLVHRLDKDTSGLLVVAKSQKVHIALASAMKERRIHRAYTAVVWGHPEPHEETIETWIGRSRTDRKRMAVFHPSGTPLQKRWGRPGEEKRMLAEIRSIEDDGDVDIRGIPRGARLSITHYRTIKGFDLATSLECILGTGRTHQVRVHLSHCGHPVVGDPVYGGRQKAVRGLVPEKRTRASSLLDQIPRQALHAAHLQFKHPVSGEDVSITADLPDDMQHLLQHLEATLQ